MQRSVFCSRVVVLRSMSLIWCSFSPVRLLLSQASV